MGWLRKIAYAARQLNYTGTFVYQHGNQVETSRIIHLADASGEIEKLEALDGPLREIVRKNDEVTCFFPASKTVKLEKRTARRNFPGLLPEQLAGLAENYTIRKADQERVAGFDCQAIVLEPKDNFRYGHRFCAENVSGLLLKARMLNDRSETLEQFAFTQLTLGGSIDKESLKPRYDGRGPGWKTDQSGPSDAGNASTGWTVGSTPPGFRKTMEMRRTLFNRSTPVTHLVFSDGLAAVSVFIEPLQKDSSMLPGLSQHGAITIFVRNHGDYRVTVLGEAPPATVTQIGNSVAYQR